MIKCGLWGNWLNSTDAINEGYTDFDFCSVIAGRNAHNRIYGENGIELTGAAPMDVTSVVVAVLAVIPRLAPLWLYIQQWA